MGSDVNVGLAFFAGILSFISPCVLPLVPAYIGYLTARAAGQSAADLRTAGAGAAIKVNRTVVFLHGVFFVLGFTLVFVGFGLILSMGVSLIAGSSALQTVQAGAIDARRILAQIGGVVVILFGLHVMGLTNWIINQIVKISPNSGLTKTLQKVQGWLYMDTRREMNPNNSAGYLGSTFMGMFFAAGWSPCIGPILGSILTLAATATTGSTFLTAGGLLLAYSIGLGVPFLAAAIAINQMKGLMKRLQKRMRLITTLSGAFLILVGVLLLNGELERLAQTGGSFADFTYNLQECTVGLFSGAVPISDWGTCINLGPNYKYRLEQGNLTPTPAAPEVTPTPAAASGTSPSGALEVGALAPSFSTQSPEGAPITLESYQGKVLLMNFWATWCGPCRSEMPVFQQLGAKYAPDGFEILALNFGESAETIQRFLTDQQLDLKVGMDVSGKINLAYKVLGYPTTYVIGRDGKIIARFTGPVESATLEAAVQKWLKGL